MLTIGEDKDLTLRYLEGEETRYCRKAIKCWRNFRRDSLVKHKRKMWEQKYFKLIKIADRYYTMVLKYKYNYSRDD